MRFAPLALAFALLPSVAAAQATGPLPAQPAALSNATATLLFEAQMAITRAAQSNPAAAQAGALSYQQAIARYQNGDYAAARAAALQALMSANRFAPQPLATIAPLAPPAAYGAPAPFPLRGSTAQIDADAFVAQARGAVAACVAGHAPNTAAASAQLAAAEKAVSKGDYTSVRREAKAAVDLCASAR